MNRRSAVQILTMILGFCEGTNVAAQTTDQPAKDSGYVEYGTGLVIASPLVINPRRSLVIDLEFISGIEIRNGKDSVKITPGEIWAALNDKPNLSSTQNN